jgi:fructose-bisphosphate aldolase class II
MALVRMDEILIPARKDSRAVGAFECWDSNSVQAIAQAASATNCPVIFQATPGDYDYCGGPKNLWQIVEIYATKNQIQAAVHLDHGTTLDHVEECLKAGFTSVMLDASSYKYDENVRLTKEAVKMAKSFNASTEAELGHIGGIEGDVSCQEDSVVLTDPDEAAAFVAETKIDCLAVAIGTVHGVYKAEPNIDLDRLRKIANCVSVPLVLHGGSGTPDDIVRACIKTGVAKINVCTELMQAWIGGLEESSKVNTLSLAGPFHEPAMAAATNLLVEKISLFNGS